MIYIGTSGFLYQSWKNLFYPSHILQSDWLNYYAQKFNTLELDISFNKIIKKDYFYKLADMTENSLKLTIQMHKDITNKNINKSNISTNILMAKKIAKLWNGLHNENWMGPLLFKFPYGFDFNKENFLKVKQILDIFLPYKKVVEFRNISWINNEVYDYFKKNKIVFCNIDTPMSPGLISKKNLYDSPEFNYIRFHGRNLNEWWMPSNTDEKYNYLYKPTELIFWVNKIKLLSKKSKDIYCIFHNYPNAYAIKNALYLMKKFNVNPAFENYQLELPFL